MKIIKFSIIFILSLLITACATQQSNGIEAFKGQSAEQMYTGGMQAIQKKDYDNATQHFEALEAFYPYGHYTEAGQLHLIYAYYKNGDYEAATAVAGRYIHLYPRSKRVDYAYYMKGLANFDKTKTWLAKIYVKDPAQRDLSSFRAAFVDFSDLVSQFPYSKYAPDARLRMIYIRNLIARHELQVANFYFERKAYVAAANRASYIVEHFAGAPQVVDALEIMVKAYTELGATKQAQDAQRILLQVKS